jgi:bifunctional enzyme CysN/CysC
VTDYDPAVLTPGRTVWLTGLSGAGKTTTAHALGDALRERGSPTITLDGDELRAGLSSDLGFSAADRDESVRRAGELSLVLARQGLIVVVALISPRTSARRNVRARHEGAGILFAEVFVDTPIAICEQRDPKELYRRARAGEAVHLSGVDDPYEVPAHPEITVSTELLTPGDVARIILSQLA